MTPISREQAIAVATAPGQPHELIDESIDGRPLRIFKNAPPSLRALFESTASELPFLSYEDERYSFAQAWAAAARIGQVLVHGCGVRHGDRVAIAMRNYPEWIFAFTAITSIGAVAVAVNAHWSAEEMAYALADSGTASSVPGCSAGGCGSMPATSAPTVASSSHDISAETMLRWLDGTPLGWPVEPEV